MIPISPAVLVRPAGGKIASVAVVIPSTRFLAKIWEIFWCFFASNEREKLHQHGQFMYDVPVVACAFSRRPQDPGKNVVCTNLLINVS
jgi:hypothetical protein